MRILGGLSLLSVLIVSFIVLAGNAQQAQHALAPLERSAKSAVSAHEASPLLTQRITVDQTMTDLYQAAKLEWVSNDGSLSRQDMLDTLRSQDPSARVGAPLASGGIDAQLSGSKLSLCADTAQGYHCVAYDLAGSARGFGDGASLRRAKRQALASVSH